MDEIEDVEYSTAKETQKASEAEQAVSNIGEIQYRKTKPNVQMILAQKRDEASQKAREIAEAIKRVKAERDFRKIAEKKANLEARKEEAELLSLETKIARNRALQARYAQAQPLPPASVSPAKLFVSPTLKNSLSSGGRTFTSSSMGLSFSGGSNKLKSSLIVGSGVKNSLLGKGGKLSSWFFSDVKKKKKR